MASNDLFAPPTKDELTKIKPVAQMSAGPQNDLFAPPSKDELVKVVGQPAQAPGIGQTALEHGANGAALGYLPQLQALAQPYVYEALNKITGRKGEDKVQPDSYLQARDENVKRLAAEEKANPHTALASQVGGGIVGAMATPIPGGAAKGVLGGLGKGALFGAGYGALQNPGDVEGEYNPKQLDERKHNALVGGLVGGTAGGVTQGIAKGLRGLGNASAAAKDIAETQAVKASGGMLKDFRALEGQDRTNEVGRYALDNGLVKLGDTTESIADKATASKDAAGKRLGDLYKSAKEGLSGAKKDMSSVWDTMTDEEFKNWQNRGFNPVRDRNQIIGAAKKALGDETDAKPAIAKLSSYLDDLGEKYGDQSLDPQKSAEIKSAMDRAVNYARNPLSREPGVETAYRAARGGVANKIQDDINFLSEYMNNPNAGKQLQTANKDFGNSKTIADMATDRSLRNNANQMFGLTDKIAGGAGVGAGALMGAAASGGHDIKHEGEGALIGALALGLLNKAGRSYGPSTLATVADKAAYPLQVAKPLGVLAPPIGSQALLRGLIQEQTLEKNLKKKKSDSSADAGLRLAN